MVAAGVGLAVLLGSLPLGAVLAAIGIGLAVVAVILGLRYPIPDPVEIPVSPAVVPLPPIPYVEPEFYPEDDSRVEFSDRIEDARHRVVRALSYVGHLVDLDTVDSSSAAYHTARTAQQREELERRARDNALKERLHEQLAEARGRLQSLRRLDHLLDEAYGYLSRSRVGARREIASALETSLGRSLPHITDGCYPHVSVDTDFRIRISDPALPALDPLRGARSTREQTYLSARVALGEQLSCRRLHGPLLLDDVTSSADAPRVHGLLDLLYRFAQVRQVAVFAHEESVAQWALGMMSTHPNVHLIRLTAVDQTPAECTAEPEID